MIMPENIRYQSYYTKSEPILDYMTNMLNLAPQDSIFEPCGGDGVFVDKMLSLLPSANISIFELNPEAVTILKHKYVKNDNIRIKLTDTLLDEDIVSHKLRFDKIIGNPPYGARNSEGKKNALSKLYPNLYTKESYTLFLYACIECLNEGGVLSFIIPDTFLSLHRHHNIRQYILQHTKIKELSMFPSSFFPGINFGYANLCIITLEKSSDVPSNMANLFYIRTGFTKVEELNDPQKSIRKKYVQADIFNNISSAFFFNSNDRIQQLVNSFMVRRIDDIAYCVTGFYSGNDKVYLKPRSMELKNAKKYTIAKTEELYEEALSDKEKTNGIQGDAHYIPIVKGGNKSYIKPNDWFINWSANAIAEYRASKKCRFQNASFYFKENGIAIPMIRSNKLTAALIDGRLFDQSIVGVFPHQENLTNYLLAFFNSSVCTQLISAINPSANNSANYIKKIPFITPSNEQLDAVNNIVSLLIKAINENEDTTYYENKLDSIFAEIYKLHET